MREPEDQDPPLSAAAKKKSPSTHRTVVFPDRGRKIETAQPPRRPTLLAAAVFLARRQECGTDRAMPHPDGAGTGPEKATLRAGVREEGLP